MKKLSRLALKTVEYSKFEDEAMQHLSWYDVPVTWTKKDLREFYQKTRGNA